MAVGDGCVEIDVLGVNLESEFSHDHFQLVFKLLVLKGILLEEALEDGVHKHLIPSYPAIFINLETPHYEITCIWAILLIDLDRFSLNILD